MQQGCFFIHYFPNSMTIEPKFSQLCYFMNRIHQVRILAFDNITKHDQGL